MEEKRLVFDMDGTLADLYGVEDWLMKLREEDPSPYAEAKPMYDMAVLTRILKLLQRDGWIIVVTSWLSKESSKEYKKAVRTAKRNWLIEQGFPVDEIHLIQYGRTKADATRKKEGVQILIDDNEKVRHGWHLGSTIDASKDILTELLDLL